MLIIISVVHFEKPVAAMEMFSDFLDNNAASDVDGPY
jgi:hypothetical protein